MLGSYCWIVCIQDFNISKFDDCQIPNGNSQMLCQYTQKQQVIHEYVNKDAQVTIAKQHISLLPSDTMDEFYLPLQMFDISKDSKNGRGGVEKTLRLNRLVQIAFEC